MQVRTGSAGWTCGRGGVSTPLPAGPFVLPHGIYPCAQRRAGASGAHRVLLHLRRSAPSLAHAQVPAVPGGSHRDAVEQHLCCMAVGCTTLSVRAWQFRETEWPYRARSPWGHRRVPSWGGVASGGVREPRAEAVPNPLGSGRTPEVRGCLPAPGLCYYGRITCEMSF